MQDVRLHRLARQDLTDSALSFEAKQSGLGDQFIDAVLQACDSIAFMPEAGSLHEKDMRMRIVKPFSYGILYRIEEDCIFALAIGDLRRNPGFWSDRIGEVESD